MKSEIRFVDRDHLAFYNQTLNQSGNNDPYHKAFFTSWGSAAKPVATSRKSVIGNTLNLPADDRVEGTIATSVIGVMKGAAFAL